MPTYVAELPVAAPDDFLVLLLPDIIDPVANLTGFELIVLGVLFPQPPPLPLLFGHEGGGQQDESLGGPQGGSLYGGIVWLFGADAGGPQDELLELDGILSSLIFG